MVDFDPSCLLSISNFGCRKIAAMHITLNEAAGSDAKLRLIAGYWNAGATKFHSQCIFVFILVIRKLLGVFHLYLVSSTLIKQSKLSSLFSVKTWFGWGCPFPRAQKPG